MRYESPSFVLLLFFSHVPQGQSLTMNQAKSHTQRHAKSYPVPFVVSRVSVTESRASSGLRDYAGAQLD
jgi:hypothetical protein